MLSFDKSNDPWLAAHVVHSSRKGPDEWHDAPKEEQVR